MTSCYSYMYDHKDYKAISSKIETLCTQKRSLSREQNEALWDMQALTHGLDAVREKLFTQEEATLANDKVLEKFTGDTSDRWSSTYGRSCDLIREKLVEQCVIIANRKVDVEVVSTQIESLNIEKDALGDKLRKEFHVHENVSELEKKVLAEDLINHGVSSEHV